MKVSLMRPALVLALALGLASCGGKAGFTIEGSISGLEYPGLVLNSNGMDLPVNPAPGTVPGTAPVAPVKFAFEKQIEYGEVYKVTVKHHPLHQTCTPDQYTDTNTAGRVLTINVPIKCGLKLNTVGGTIDGLTADGLVLANGSAGGIVEAPKDATTFVFSRTVMWGETYGVTVQAQPTGQTCSVVANGSGVMDDANVENIAVRCNANP